MAGHPDDLPGRRRNDAHPVLTAAVRLWDLHYHLLVSDDLVCFGLQSVVKKDLHVGSAGGDNRRHCRARRVGRRQLLRGRKDRMGRDRDPGWNHLPLLRLLGERILQSKIRSQHVDNVRIQRTVWDVRVPGVRILLPHPVLR